MSGRGSAVQQESGQLVDDVREGGEGECGIVRLGWPHRGEDDGGVNGGPSENNDDVMTGEMMMPPPRHTLPHQMMGECPGM